MAPDSAKKNIRLTDWYSCSKLESATIWNCEYVSTSAEYVGGWADFNNPYVYTTLTQVTTTTDPGGACAKEPAPHAYSPMPDADDMLQTDPNCSIAYTSTNDPKGQLRAWCAGEPLTQNQTRKSRVEEALNNMWELGGECTILANIGYELLNNGHIRVYTPSSKFPYTGGGWGGPQGAGVNGSILLKDGWTDVFYDDQKFEKRTTRLDGANSDIEIKRNLQYALAHELDHLRGRVHLDQLRGVS